MDKRIIIGADDSGFTLKEAVKEHLLKNGYDVTDVGTLSLDEPVVYYEVGRRVAKEVADKKFERGLLFCGTGMGVNLVANKFPGVYCGLCESVFAAKKCRIINNCNVLAMGGFIVGPKMGIEMAEAFLNTDFSYGFDLATPEFLQNAVKEIDQISADVLKEHSK